jgi:hypothetical protein
VDTAVKQARRVWTKAYKPTVTTPSTGIPLQKRASAFSILDTPCIETSGDPFDEFIKGKQSNDDAVEYWSAIWPRDSKTITPRQALARMALDFLAAPAASTDVERLFSKSGLIVSKKRHNLTPNHIRESTVLGNWLTVPGLVPVNAIQHKLDKGYGKQKMGASDDESLWSDSQAASPSSADESDESIKILDKCSCYGSDTEHASN